MLVQVQVLALDRRFALLVLVQALALDRRFVLRHATDDIRSRQGCHHFMPGISSCRAQNDDIRSCQG